MLTTTPPICHLPQEILVEILSSLEIWEFPNLASTCKTLHRAIYGPDETRFWGIQHDALYDDPLQASAYLAPRRQIGWRRRVTTRAQVLQFLETTDTGAETLYEGELQYWSGYCAGQHIRRSRRRYPATRQSYEKFKVYLHSWAPRVLSTCLELYLDIPAGGSPSLNAEILDHLATTKFLWHCIRYATEPPARVGDLALPNSPLAQAQHLRAIFLGAYQDKLFNSTGYTLDEQWPAPLSGPVNWGAVSVYACSDNDIRPEWHISHIRRDLRAQRGLQDRGTGLLNHNPIGSQDENSPWDWAGVGGDWGSSSRECRRLPTIVLPNERLGIPGPYPYFPVRFCLTPLRDKEQIDAAFSSLVYEEREPRYIFGLREPHDIGILWDHFPSIGRYDGDDRFPPIYFHGAGNNYGSAPSQFLYGVVHLSTDNPPEVIWTMAMQNVVFEKVGSILRMVQIGGCGSKVGIVGVECDRVFGRNQEPDPIDLQPVRAPREVYFGHHRHIVCTRYR